uniref:7TM_GPCR_Srx domain-containing protein n=1 Tax=Globodera pallida TaxID=36090 RepID=A0A183C8U3_GLOPA
MRKPYFEFRFGTKAFATNVTRALLRGKRLNSSNLFDQFIVSYFTPNSSLFRAHLPAKRGAIIAAGASDDAIECLARGLCPFEVTDNETVDQHNPAVAEAAEHQTEEALQNCFESEGFVKFQFTVDDLLLAATTASTFFNVLVIICAFRLFKRSGDTMHVFIISKECDMTFGDLLLTVFCHPNEFLIRKHEFLRHVGLCSIIHFCNWIGLAVSGLSLTLLNVDKLIYFRWPLSYERTMSCYSGRD